MRCFDLLRMVLAIVAFGFVAACGQPEQRGPVVLAAASTQEALEAVAQEWAASGHPAPVLSFSGTPSLARQVEQGAPADIVLTADSEWMDWLESNRLVREGTRRIVAGNALTLVGAAPLPECQSIRERLLAMGPGRLAIAEPESVPAGRYARTTLVRMGLWDALAPNVVPADSVRGALALVEAGEADLGIVYATDARYSDRVFDAETFEPRDMPAIQYPAALVASSAHPDAMRFLQFLSSPAAQAILTSHGFIPAERAQ